MAFHDYFNVELVSFYLRGMLSSNGVLLGRQKERNEYCSRQSNMFPAAHFLILLILTEQNIKTIIRFYLAYSYIHTRIHTSLYIRVCVCVYIDYLYLIILTVQL